MFQEGNGHSSASQDDRISHYVRGFSKLTGSEFGDEELLGVSCEQKGTEVEPAVADNSSFDVKCSVDGAEVWLS